jgi:hypothetical protein
MDPPETKMAFYGRTTGALSASIAVNELGTALCFILVVNALSYFFEVFSASY